MEAEYEEKRRIMKLRRLGIIRFIGELFRKGFLQERIMHECIMKLMDVRLNSDGMLVCAHPSNPPDEECIESLAVFLTTMGKDLDRHGAQGFMPSYFHYLEKVLVKDKRLSTHITCMIKDVIELRRHTWEPRRKEAEQGSRAPPSSAPSGGGRDRIGGDHFRSGLRSRGDGFKSGRSRTMAPVHQHSQSMSRDNIQMTRDINAGVNTGPSSRPAVFGFGRRVGGRGGASGSSASFPTTEASPTKLQSPAPRATAIPPLDEAVH